MSIDLSTLPPPNVVEPLNYADILKQMQDDFVSRWPDYAFEPHDPVTKVLEVSAFRELALRQRLNEAAKANLLAFAQSADLDHLAAFYGVERLAGEADAALRRRVQLRISGWGAGTSDYYRYHALSASGHVLDAFVSRGEAGQVEVALLTDGTDGVLETVTHYLHRDNIRMMSDLVAVGLATAHPIKVEANLWRTPNALSNVLSLVNEAVVNAFKQAAGLGWDVTTSWLMAQMHIAGVQKVELITPKQDTVIPNNGYAQLTQVVLHDQGEAW